MAPIFKMATLIKQKLSLGGVDFQNGVTHPSNIDNFGKNY
jgi:hypothetical protein